jgi:hypothetical protein
VAPTLPWTQHRKLSLVVLVGAVAALAASSQSTHGSTAAERAPARAATEPSGQAPPSWAFAMPIDGDLSVSSDEVADDTRIAGTVLEQIDVAKYSYLRLGVEGGSDTWTAVPVTTPLVGQSVVVSDAERMTSFVSATLARTFDVIYFGVLDSPGAGGEAPVAPGLEALSESAHENHWAPHPGPGREADAVPVAKSDRAPGPLGRTVAELNALDATASGSRARVHATVVKVTTGVMGRTFVHLRDASGIAPLTHDVTATTTEELGVGSEVLLEGRVEIDKDFGSGYRYRVLLADAQRVQP